MTNRKNNTSNSEPNLFELLISKFMPFWPLFLALTIFGILVGWVYLHFATPLYEINATLIIKDEQKGVDDPNMMESINVFDSKKIVENEIEVIQSRGLMGTVIKDLCLYVDLYEDGALSDNSAYTVSPVVVEFKSPEKIIPPGPGGPKKYHFTFDSHKQVVKIDGKTYPLEEWVIGPDGYEVRYKPNESQEEKTTNSFYYTLNDLRSLTLSLQEGLEVQAANKLSTVVRLSYKDPIPRRGEDILNRLIYSYNQKAVNDRNQLADNTLAFIDERMQKVSEELNALEREVQDFRSSKSVVDLSEQGRLYLRDVGDYDRQISELQSQLAVLNGVESYVVSKKNQGGIVPSTLGVNDPVLSQLLQRLYNAEIDYERLKNTTAENNPILVSLSDEIEKVRPSILENIRNQKSNIGASLGSLAYNSDKSSTALKSLPEKERTLLEITRRKMIKNNLFTFLQQKREETALSYAPYSGDSRVVDVAEASLYPVSPKRLFTYALALALSLLAGVAYVIIREKLNPKLLFRSEIENNTDIPVVAEFPQIDEAERATFENDLQPVMIEQFRQIGIKLGLYSRDFQKQKILVTSSIAGEGKSFISANLALCLAETGKRVVLLDMDLRKPRISQLYNVIEKKGIVDFLKNEVSYIDLLNKVTDNDYLSVVSAGTKGGDFARLLQVDKLDVLFDYLTENFDYIIVDSAPMNLVSEVNLIAEFCDDILFVTRHDHTPKRVINSLEKTSSLASFENVGIVFNGVKRRGLTRNDYGFGYGYEYDYGLKEY